MEKIYDLSNDAMFKLYFSNAKILADFINIINKEFNLFDGIVEAKDIEYLNTIFPSGINKNTNMDILFRINKNNSYYNFEMQKYKPNYDIDARMVYYHSKLISNSLIKGANYGEANVTSIWFFNYEDKNLYNNSWYNLYNIKDQNNKIISKASFCIIALFLKQMSLSSIIELREFAKFFMENALNFKPTTKLTREGQIMLKKLNEDEKARFIAASIEDKERAYNSDMYYSRLKGIQQGKLEGIQEGIQQGKLEGIQEGIQQGKLEGIQENTIKMVKALYEKGISLEIISDVSNLSIEKIMKIIEQ